MTSKTRRLAFTAGFVVLFALTIWSWMPGKAVSEGAVTASDGRADPSLSATRSPGETLSSDATVPPQTSSLGGERQGYAIGLHDVAGLSHDTSPGTVVDLWVAWDPPITKEPQYQRLIPSVIIEEIQPPFVAEGPFTVMLSVPAKKIGDLLYADRYGAISATTPTS